MQKRDFLVFLSAIQLSGIQPMCHIHISGSTPIWVPFIWLNQENMCLYAFLEHIRFQNC
jgi:hypothetical protein